MRRLRQLIAADIPFARDDAHRLLPMMIACLIGFSALLLSVAMCIHHAIADQSQSVIGVLQVEVPRARADDKTLFQNVTDLLAHTPGVTAVNVLSTQAMEGLLKPWLGENFKIADLPVPVVIDVKTAVEDQKAAVDVEALRRGLMKIDAGIRVDDRGPWVGQVTQAASLLQALVVFIAVLLLACVLGMVMLVAKTSLRLHFKTVSLLHTFGATDEYILRQFQWNSAWLAARGAFAGVLFAGMVFSIAVLFTMRWHSPVLPEIHVSLAHGFLFVVMPLLTAGIAWLATRLTVRSMLQQMH